jgi:hypothetical protein
LEDKTMDALFSKIIKAGDRTYFIDVKEAKNKSKYLTIAESKPSKEGEKKFTRSSVMIFDNQATKVRDALVEAIGVMQK